MGRRLFTINYRRALPYAMIFCPFRALMQCIDKFRSRDAMHCVSTNHGDCN
ncbi:MAG: hypothetical protein LBQ66_10715 [Planctomycetaceae bacterium]|nr:hypothetical protein [Planctomycetaceae bacterium]